MSPEAKPYSNTYGSLVLSHRQAAAAVLIGSIGATAGAVIGPPGSAAVGALLAFALAWASVVDIDRYILPDAVTLPLTLAGLLAHSSNGVASAAPYALGAVAGYLSLASVAFIYERIRRRSGLGLGDAKLLAAGGAWLGWTALPLIVLAASLSCLGVLVCVWLLRRERLPQGPVAFGPYIALSIWLVWLAQLGART